MRNGNRNKVASFEKKVAGPEDDLGVPTESWEPIRCYTDLFCAVEPRRGAVFYDQTTRQSVSRVVYRFRFAYPDVDGVSPDMSIVYEGRRYEILASLPDEHFSSDWWFDAALRSDQKGVDEGCIP